MIPEDKDEAIEKTNKDESQESSKEPKVVSKKKSKDKKEEPPKEQEKKEEPKKKSKDKKEEPKKEQEDKKEEPKKEQEDKKEEHKRYGREPSFERELWKPKTRLGEMVKNGEITSMSEVLRSGSPIREVGIVDALLPELQEEILVVGRIQRVTDSGRRMRFRVVAGVGNGDGFVGVGHAKGKEAGPTIRKAIERAKLRIVEIKRGCGSWVCGCGDPHTVPFKVNGKSGSVSIELMPAPRGVGLVSGEIPRKVLTLAGISDIWVRTEGHTRTSFNFSYAVFNALVNTNYVKIREKDTENLGIISGPVE